MAGRTGPEPVLSLSKEREFEIVYWSLQAKIKKRQGINSYPFSTACIKHPPEDTERAVFIGPCCKANKIRPIFGLTQSKRVPIKHLKLATDPILQ
jgi:hypothetical protein